MVGSAEKVFTRIQDHTLLFNGKHIPMEEGKNVKK